MRCQGDQVRTVSQGKGLAVFLGREWRHVDALTQPVYVERVLERVQLVEWTSELQVQVLLHHGFFVGQIEYMRIPYDETSNRNCAVDTASKTLSLEGLGTVAEGQGHV